MPIYSKGTFPTWPSSNTMWIKNSGSWVQARNGWIKVNGVWKKFISEVPVVSYTGSYSIQNTGGNSRILWLKSSGTLTVKHVPWVTHAAHLIGGGGGGGGVADRTAGGGGGGGYNRVSGPMISIGSYSTVIGAGGSGGTYWSAGTSGGQTYCYGIKRTSDSKIFVASGGGRGGGGISGYVTAPTAGASGGEDAYYVYSASSGGGGFHYSNQAGAGGTAAGGKGWDVASSPPFLFAAGGGGGVGGVGKDGFVSVPPPVGYVQRLNHAGTGGTGTAISSYNYCYGGGGGLQGAYNGSVGGDTYWFAFDQASGGDPTNPTSGQGGWYSVWGDYGATSAPANSGGGGGGGGQRVGGGTFSSGNGGSGVIGIEYTLGDIEVE